MLDLMLAVPPGSTVLLLASGGLDSTTLAYWLREHGSRLVLVSFDYGQRHRIELEHAGRTAASLEAGHQVVDLHWLGGLLAGSALTDQSVAVPDGHYRDESMRVTVVPNRNALMLDIAVALAVVQRADAVAFGAHAGDHAVYPDCRSGFVEAFTRTARIGNEGFLTDGFGVLAPFLTWSKADIVRLGAELSVPFELTWSCYRGGPMHCGRCGTCTERREAFGLAGVADPTAYRTVA